jgi:hypothetical protein
VNVDRCGQIWSHYLSIFLVIETLPVRRSGYIIHRIMWLDDPELEVSPGSTEELRENGQRQHMWDNVPAMNRVV